MRDIVVTRNSAGGVGNLAIGGGDVGGHRFSSDGRRAGSDPAGNVQRPVGPVWLAHRPEDGFDPGVGFGRAEAAVTDWDQLPGWQQQTDADIFEHIEQEHADG
jgi:hypothetical protein